MKIISSYSGNGALAFIRVDVEDRSPFVVDRGVLDHVGRAADVHVVAALAGDPRVGAPGDEATDDRRHPERPQLTRGTVAVEEGDGGRAGRVDRGVADRDRDEVREEQAEADRERGEAPGGVVL